MLEAVLSKRLHTSAFIFSWDNHPSIKVYSKKGPNTDTIVKCISILFKSANLLFLIPAIFWIGM